MIYNTWPEGSQWRKWDLHVHTPASFHWNGGNLLRNMTNEEKNSTFRELLDILESTDVAVFCFTDYWTFDGYLQFRDYLKNNNLTCSKTIFPGMELRVEAPVDYRLNTQVILSDALTNQELDDFKSNLIIRSINRQISDESIMAFAKTLDNSKAKIHGFGAPGSLNDDDLLLLGASTIEITRESLKTAFQSIPPSTAYIVLPYDTSDGIIDLDWKTQPQADNYFMQTAHIFESRKDESVDLFLGLETDKNRDFIENFRKTLNYVPKPVLCGSDAHRFSDYGRYPNNKATWIKADPTFQGFKQIIYEPRERVRIQELQPEEKTPYLVIDKVRFIDNTNSKLFPNDWIHLNRNFNAIIGGKSSGKSLLLYHIAKTVTPELIDKRGKEVTILDYHFGDIKQFDFEVVWKDGFSEKLSTSDEHSAREIEYIPQMYVNSLAEKEGKASLYKLIESILQQNTTYRDFFQQKKQEISQLEANIEQDVSELLRLRSELQRLTDERRIIGDFTAINNEIGRLSTGISKLREESDFSIAEKDQYEKLLHQRVVQGQRKHKYEELNNSITSLTHAIELTEKQTIRILEDQSADIGLDRFSKKVLAILRTSATKIIAKAFAEIARSQRVLAQRSHDKAVKCEEYIRENHFIEFTALCCKSERSRTTKGTYVATGKTARGPSRSLLKKWSILDPPQKSKNGVKLWQFISQEYRHAWKTQTAAQLF